MREGFLPQVTMRISRLGQGDPAPSPSPAPSPAPSSGDGADTGDGFNRFPFFPTFFSGPSYPYYYQQPYYPPARPRYICTRKEDDDGEERFICEPEEAPSAPVAPIAPYYPRTSVLYVRPFTGSWFY